MGSCHSTTNSSKDTLNFDENLEIFSLIWLDKSQKTYFPQQKFRAIINFLKIFHNENDCEEYIKKNSRK